MGKKSRDKYESSVKKGKKNRTPFSFLDTTFENADKTTVYHHILLLVIAAIVSKFIVGLVTTAVFHSFIDLFDIGYYLDQSLLLAGGQVPYLDFDFAYPVLLFIPIIIALVPAIATNNAMMFVFTFQALMVLCDIVTIICIYLIGLKLWNERMAFYAGLLYACAFSAAYFVITKYDSFPTALLMLAILFTIYRHEIKGYIASVLGFFTKVFPILAAPFFVLYNAKKTSLKQEIITAAKVAIPLFAVLFLPLFFLRPDTFQLYIPVRSELGYYSNTLTFTVYSWIHDVFRIGISIDVISAIMYIGMGAGILALLYTAYVVPGRDPKLLIKLILCATILVVICAKVRSPQYIVWFTPMICLLAVDDIRKIALLFVYQALAYIEFPLMFGAYYTAVEYTDPVLSSGWMLTLMMFTLEYLALLACVWLVVDPKKIFSKLSTKTASDG
jgi:hypothetical protein